MRTAIVRWSVTCGVATVIAGVVYHAGTTVQAQRELARQSRAEIGVSVIDFQKQHAAGEVLPVDVRSAASFAEGHISGAVGLPLADLIAGTADMSWLRRTAGARLVVTYCACPTEASSLRAADLLRAGGIEARALVGGYEAWVDAGGAIERQ
jgi:rhodanese-related sulfurtransferase